MFEIVRPAVYPRSFRKAAAGLVDQTTVDQIGNQELLRPGDLIGREI
jgi:hypothetical protein